MALASRVECSGAQVEVRARLGLGRELPAHGGEPGAGGGFVLAVKEVAVFDAEEGGGAGEELEGDALGEAAAEEGDGAGRKTCAVRREEDAASIGRDAADGIERDENEGIGTHAGPIDEAADERGGVVGLEAALEANDDEIVALEIEPMRPLVTALLIASAHVKSMTSREKRRSQELP